MKFSRPFFGKPKRAYLAHIAAISFHFNTLILRNTYASQSVSAFPPRPGLVSLPVDSSTTELLFFGTIIVRTKPTHTFTFCGDPIYRCAIRMHGSSDLLLLIPTLYVLLLLLLLLSRTLRGLLCANYSTTTDDADTVLLMLMGSGRDCWESDRWNAEKKTRSFSAFYPHEDKCEITLKWILRLLLMLMLYFRCGGGGNDRRVAVLLLLQLLWCPLRLSQAPYVWVPNRTGDVCSFCVPFSRLTVFLIFPASFYFLMFFFRVILHLLCNGLSGFGWDLLPIGRTNSLLRDPMNMN